MVNMGEELVRINPKDNKKIEASKNDGKTWTSRYPGGSPGLFSELTANGDEILATTDKGLFYSKNNGKTWNKRS